MKNNKLLLIIGSYSCRKSKDLLNLNRLAEHDNDENKA